MIIDTSALLTVIFGEPDSARIIEAVTEAEEPAVGSPTVFEAEMVVAARRGARGVAALHRFLDELGISELPFGPDHRRAAAEAFVRYGKGRHPARLNLGDCLTYGVAKVAGEPLLCIGGDFSRTDLEIVPLD